MAIYIIAEAGVNHNGSLELAKKLVDMAKRCGADAIKFQTFKAEETTSGFAKKAEYQQKNDNTKESQLDMIKKLELPFEDFRVLKEYSKKIGIEFISTPDGIESLDYLIKIDTPIIKIGSTEVTNIEFLKEIAIKNKKTILSTGMSSLGEVEKAVNIFRECNNPNLILMHCTTDYPTEYKDVNIRAMQTLKEAFKLNIGYSDHTLGSEAAIAAVVLGAKVIEKHITLDKNMKGPDHKASMNELEFEKYVNSIRNTEKLLGDGIKKPTQNEIKIMKDVRRSILVKEDLKKGTVLTKNMFVYKRPGNGISPEFSDIVEGRALKRNYKKEEMIRWEDI